MNRTPLRRSGFKRPDPKPAKQVDYIARPREACVIEGLVARASVAVPKRAYVRSKDLREAYRLIPCQFDRENEPGVPCGVLAMVCCCHSNWSVHGKGKSIKASDDRAASGCPWHHRMLDQGGTWTEAERKERWWAAHVRSVDLLSLRGLWPKGIPVPDITNNPF